MAATYRIHHWLLQIYLSREILPFITDISTFLGISTENTDPEKATSGPPTPPPLPRFDAKKK
jgi:hypothetical protein